jgi:O-antigen/teichoic acid export membrane protein
MRRAGGVVPLDLVRTIRRSRTMALLAVARLRGRFAGRIVALAFATAAQTAISIIQMLLVTRILSADDFGIYGMLISGVALAGAMCDGGAGLIAPAHHAVVTPAERARLFASLAVFAATIGTVFGLILIGSWPWLRLLIKQNTITSISFVIIIIVAVLTPLRAVVQQTVTIFSVSGRGIAIAIQMLIQSICGFVVTLISLFALNAGVAALFLGTLAANIAALAVGLWMLGGSHGTEPPSRRWLALILRTAPTASVRGFADAGWSVAANAVLGHLRGLEAVGIFGQARLYNGFLLSFGNVVAHNATQLSLSEARKSDSDFGATRRIWAPVQVAIVVFGLVFAFAGKEIVALLTNGKLTAAAIYVPLFAAITLIQNSGKAVTAVIYANGLAPSAARFRTALVVLNLLALYPTVFAFGIGGVLGLLFAEAVAYRLFLRAFAARSRRSPWQDEIVVAGIIVLLVSSLYVNSFEPNLSVRLGILAVILAIIVALGRRVLTDVIATGRDLLYPRSV